MWSGIDYGSKTAGTTAICLGAKPDDLIVFATEKRQNADHFLYTVLNNHKPEFACIDAPLSLPGKFIGKAESDYFYRQCDMELKAMSPMFIGGLTARAIKLKEECNHIGIKLIETYPAAFVRHHQIPHYNKKNKSLIPDFLKQLQKPFGVKINPNMINSWHEVDAIIAWISAYRLAKRKHISFGHDDEGTIVI